MTTYSMPLLALDAVVLDTETTGMDAKSARVIQIGAIKIAAGAVAQEPPFDTLVDPGIAVPSGAARITGITTEMVAGQPIFATLAPTLTAFIGTRIIVGHTIGYDLTVLSREYTAAGLPAPAWRTLDIRHLARVAAPTLADYSLEGLCDWLDITIEGRHTALGDAHATAAVFLALIPKLRERNIRTLAEAEAASRAIIDSEIAAGSRPFETAPPPPPVFQRLDSYAYRTRVADVMSSPPLIAPTGASLSDVLQRLIDTGASSMFVKMPDGADGIITERDILRVVARNGAVGLTSSVEAFARSPLQSVRITDLLYRSLGRMNRLGIRHLGVVDANGKVVGAVTTRNLLKHRAGAATVLGDAIDGATSAQDLAAAWSRLAPMARSLIADEVRPLEVCAVVSSEICAMTARAAELAVAKMAADGQGPPPQPFAVLVLGSAARGESQLAADQDNAIVYAAGEENGPADRWFAAMAEIMCINLDQAGIPLCKGGVMARNRAWRKSLDDWKQTIDGWVRRKRPEDLLNVDIFFDAIPVHGAVQLADALRDHAFVQGHASRAFQALLTENARAPASPYTLFGSVRTDEKGRLDVKRYGLMPLFTAARVLAIRHDVRERSTRARLEGVLSRGHGNAQEIDAMIKGQEALLGYILAQQLLDIEAGVPPSTRIVVNRLSRADKDILKTSLEAVAVSAGMVAEGRL